MKKFILAAAGAALIAAAGTFGAAAPAEAAHKCGIIAKFDKNRDGKLNIFEAKRAGKGLWKKLNPDRDFTLEYNEVEHRISKHTFNKWNKIGRRGLDIIEWKRLVKHRFNAANPDGDRTIECDELQTHAGYRLMAVIDH